MSYWRNVEEVSGLHGGFRWGAGLFLFAILVVHYLRPLERKRVRSALVLFGISFGGLLAAAGCLSYGMSPNDWIFLVFRGVSLFMLAAAIVTVAGVFIFTIALRSVRLEPPEIAQDLLVALVYITAAIAVLSQCGVDLRGIVATSAVITAVIGFSLQDSLGNIIGGTFLQVEQAIRVGDWIKVDDIEGRVKATRWRQTSIETRNWDTVVIPNSVLVKAKVTVIGRRSGSPMQHRQWVYFQVSLNHSPTHVIETVETALRAEPIQHVAANPKIHCLLTAMKDGDGTYAVRYWLTDLSQPDPTDSLIRTRIYMALHRADIPLAVPSQSVLITEEHSHREHLMSKETNKRSAALSRIELFRPLTDDERNEIAERLIPAPFVRGEAITQQGAQAHWLYIMTSGEADVRITIDGVSRKVGELRAGDYFGEMGLMTGEPRSATVVARTDVHCYRLSREAFESILLRRPELVDDISATLAYRRVGLEAAREEASEEALRDRIQTTQHAFLVRMRDFFGLASASNQRN
jgi:small-conductance mechanosensitive channel/CRP-like cAMP-binding protein